MTLGIIIIGRNEGERLARCLGSVAAAGRRVVYVDSGSTDGSVALARAKGAEVVELDTSVRFCAARARNAGSARLRQVAPDAAWVQFVDGDCEVRAGWLERAEGELAGRADVAIVCGRLRERSPGASVYNRLCDMEWDSEAGEVRSCGGNFMGRVDALAAVGGFNSEIVAGEEPELCARLRQKGWKIVRIDAEMALHDAAMTRLAQWWRREQRNGYGGLDVSRRFAHVRAEGLFVDNVRSARVWTLGWLGALMVAAGAAGALAGPVAALAVGAVVALGLPLQVARLAWRVRRRVPLRIAVAYGALTLIGKWAQLVGHVRWWRDRRLARVAPLIEYKVPPTDPALQPEAPTMAIDPDWQADLRRYPPRPWLKEQSIWAIAVYRWGRRIDRRPAGVRRRCADRLYWLVYRVVETLTGISVPKSVEVGPGLRIYHFGNIFIHAEAKIGANCVLRQGVTIGNRHADGPVPRLEDDVELGAYAQVLGGVVIGKGARIGAMSVVLCDVPAGATAVGIPARVIAPSGLAPSGLGAAGLGPGAAGGAGVAAEREGSQTP